MKKARKTLLAMTLGLFIAGISGTVFAASENTHVVTEGDTFWKISRQYQCDLDELMKANAAYDPLQLVPGTVVQLPPSKKTVRAARAESAQSAKSAQAAHSVIKTPSGKTMKFERMLNAKATAYSASPAENGGYAGVDYFGNPLKIGSIAVDPNVIPLGSTVYITGYKADGLPAKGMIARAVDIGGAVKGSKVDIFVPGKEASDFGIQNVKVYVLK